MTAPYVLNTFVIAFIGWQARRLVVSVNSLEKTISDDRLGQAKEIGAIRLDFEQRINAARAQAVKNLTDHERIIHNGK